MKNNSETIVNQLIHKLLVLILLPVLVLILVLSLSPIKEKSIDLNNHSTKLIHKGYGGE